MNKDLTSDIKQVQRFIFDNSIYLLNMFQKKIDSFITTKTKKQREKQLSITRQQNNRIDPNTFFDDPIKTLARDLTKPIWNCVTKIDPFVFVDDGDWWQRDSRKSMDDQDTSTPMSQYRQLYTSLVKTFIHRYKTQHQDQSNLTINTFYCQRQSNLTQKLNIEQRQITQSQRQLTKELFVLLMRCIQRENQFLESLSDLGQVEENYRYLRATLQAYSEIVGGYLEEDRQRQHVGEQSKELDWFLKIAMQSIVSMLDSRSGSTLLTIQPHIGLINLLIHPLLITIHNILMIQFRYNDKQRNLRDQNHNKHHNANAQYINPKQLMQVQDEGKKPQGSKEQLSGQSNTNNAKSNHNSIVFEQLKYSNCSRIAFINLDGYQSQFNLQTVKYLSRNLMYVSFPKQSSNHLQSSKLKQFQHYKSQRLLRKFFYQSLTEEQKKQLLKLHAIQQKEFKKNMFILPVHSRALNEKYQLLSDNGVEGSSVQFYQSQFVKFMMEEIVMAHLRQYNPSMIVLTYSGKVNVDNQYFVQMVKQLTVISNFRLLLYVNHAKMFCFQQKGQEVAAGEEFFQQQQLYYQLYQKPKINVFHSESKVGMNTGQHDSSSIGINLQNLQLDFLDKLSIFLKVSSGTYTLSKCAQQDSYIQKYKNYKIMRYSALLLKNIAKQYPTIEKLRMRSNQYLTISKVLKNHYSNKAETFDKLFQKVITKYHDSLVKVVEKFLFLDGKILEVATEQLAQQFTQEEVKVIISCKQLLNKVNSRYEYITKKQLWQDFKFQYKLQLSTEKTESRFYLHIPKFKEKIHLQSTKNIEDLVAAVEFEIIDQKEKLHVQLTHSSKIIYAKTRVYKDALVYVINHVPKQKATNYFSFCGVINQMVDHKAEMKIQLKPITFFNERKLGQFQHYIDFNYLETQRYVFMFWPRVYDDVKDKISRILGEKYVAEPTWDMFRAQRNQPDKFFPLKVINNTYQQVIPRHGCTSYQPFTNINRFYIFGGFYNSEENYLNFQTDVTFVDFLDDSQQVKVVNLPKSFYVVSENNQQLEGISFVKEFRNDFVRPRMEFEIYEVEKQLVEEKKEVFLLGGVGEKFMRPYSLISYTGNKLTFQADATLSSIKRIKTNNLLPVNLSTPTKSRAPQEMNVVTNAQNRNIYINEGMITQQSVVMSHYRYFYDHNQQKFDFETVYEFADLEKKNYREETQCLRRAPTEYPVKYELMACSFRGKQFYNNFIKVSSENGKKYIFQLMLQLSMQVKTTYQNYQKIVRLTGASILAIDINASMLYCLIKHPSYTLDKCILAHFDINDLSGKLIDTRSVEIQLKEIHKFDCDVSKNIIIVLNSNTVTVLHGYRFNQQVEIPEMILKKHRKNQIKTLMVKPSQQASAILTQQQLHKHIVNQISSSFFINQNSGVILCLTFKSIQRNKPQQFSHGLIERVYLRIQRLDITREQYRWKMVNERFYDFKVGGRESVGNKSEQTISVSFEQHLTETTVPTKKNYLRLIEIRQNKEVKQRRQKDFLLKAAYNQQMYTATLNVDNLTQSLQFTTTNQSQEQYYKSIYKDNIKQESIYLEKNPYFYQEVKEISQLHYQSMSNISLQMNDMDLEGNKV